MCYITRRLILKLLAAVVLLAVANFVIQYASAYSIPILTSDFLVSVFEQISTGHRNVESTTLDFKEKQNNHTKCETIHIGIVCGGYKSNVYLHVMLKSIFLYRKNPLHFHIMVNKISEKILKTLFETWDLPEVRLSLYDVSDFIPYVRWVPNRHYSGVYGLLKVMFPKAIPLNITSKIIVLDTDLTFMGDIYELWSEFKNFTKNQSIGLIENQSSYYLGKLGVRRPWPAIGKGFNTGVILYDLHKLHVMEWDQLWTRIANETIPLYGMAKLPDQDIINVVIKENSQLLYHVPCQWNIQLSFFTQSDRCYSHNPIKVLHWNSGQKFRAPNNKNKTFFRNIYKTINVYDGNLLRTQLQECTRIADNIKENPIIDGCLNISEVTNNPWRTLLFFRDFTYKFVKNDVTLVTQLSYNKLKIAEKLSSQWKGPISLTLYVTDLELQKCIDFIGSSKTLRRRFNIAYHAVFKESNFLPVNELLNTGIRNARTPYVFLTDVDVLPMKTLYSNLRKYLDEVSNTQRTVAFVVPAFEIDDYSIKFPNDKNVLLSMLKKEILFIHQRNRYPEAYAPIDFKKWETATKPYQINWQPNFQPYVVVPQNVTEYDKRILGYELSRLSHTMVLAAQNYQFTVLPKAFVVQQNQFGNYNSNEFKNSLSYKKCLESLQNKLFEELSAKYNHILDDS